LLAWEWRIPSEPIEGAEKWGDGSLEGGGKGPRGGWEGALKKERCVKRRGGGVSDSNLLWVGATQNRKKY